MRRWLIPTITLTLATSPLLGQSEAVLKQYFEGRTVTPKLAMPGSDDGVDVYPGTARPLDYSQYASRLKQYGTAIKSGEPTIVTKIKVKSRLIEFQLAGGGYGTFGDETSSNVAVTPAPKTKREKNLEAEVDRETDPAKKRALREQLDDVRSEREREDARNRSAVAEAEEHRKQNIRERRLEGGSRFNLRYADRVPPEVLTPSGIMAALGEYVSFGQPVTNVGEPSSATPQPSSGALHKGMLLAEVDAVLGTPTSSMQRKEGSLAVVTRKYSASIGQVSAEFVEGVLIRYTVISN